MLIIDKTYNGYTVQAKEPGMGRGWKSEARNIEEVTLAIAHYYDGHKNNGADIDVCPFCRHSVKERQKLATKYK